MRLDSALFCIVVVGVDAMDMERPSMFTRRRIQYVLCGAKAKIILMKFTLATKTPTRANEFS